MTIERRFRAMGSQCHVMVLGGSKELADAAERRLRELECLWSRFLETSEISGVNRSSGEAVQVSPETRALVARMVMAWEVTGGRFDPTLLPALEMIGYDRSFEEGLDREGALQPLPGDGCEGIVVDEDAGTVQVPANVRLDPGGIGKGFAADIVAEELMAGGATGVLVNVGGDLRVLGEGPVDGAWLIDIDEPAVGGDRLIQVLVPGGSGIATTTPLLKEWRFGEERVHHLVDPVTGLPYESVARLVSVVAAHAWWAEACTKHIAGLSPHVAEGVLYEAAALMVDESGHTHLLRGMERYAA